MVSGISKAEEHEWTREMKVESRSVPVRLDIPVVELRTKVWLRMAME